MSQAVVTGTREHRRHAPTILTADLERNGARTKSYLLNVSLGGAFLAVEEPPRPDEIVGLHLVLPWGMGECSLKARTVWVQTDEGSRAIGAGLSFEDVSDDVRGKLANYLARFVELEGEITR